MSARATESASRSAPAVIELREVRVRFGADEVVSVPTLEVRPGEVLGIIGPNGSGKSTLLRVMALLQRPSEGQLVFAGQLVDHKAANLALRRRLAIVFQEPLLLNASVLDNVATGLRFRGLPSDAVRGRAHTWMRQLGIEHLAKRSARLLSGGEAQRVSLARALALEPEVLLLDEPFAALDAPTRQSLIEDLERILADTRVTTVLVTHDRTEALALSHRLAVMIDGRILQLDTPEVVFSSPTDERVASFVGVETVLPGVVVREDDGLAFVDIGPALVQVVGQCRPGQRVVVCLRPENITLARAEESRPTTSARNTLPGVIVKATPLGPLVRVAVDCGVPLVAVVTTQSWRELGLEPGASVAASFKATAAHLIIKE